MRVGMLTVSPADPSFMTFWPRKGNGGRQLRATPALYTGLLHDSFSPSRSKHLWRPSALNPGTKL